jgi:hypothetical protein
MKYVVLFNLSFIILFAFLFWQLYLIVFVKEQPECDKCTLHKNNRLYDIFTTNKMK